MKKEKEIKKKKLSVKITSTVSYASCSNLLERKKKYRKVDRHQNQYKHSYFSLSISSTIIFFSSSLYTFHLSVFHLSHQTLEIKTICKILTLSLLSTQLPLHTQILFPFLLMFFFFALIQFIHNFSFFL